MKKFKDPIEAYILLKLLCFNLEDNQGFKMSPEDEEHFKKMIMEGPDKEEDLGEL